VTGIPLRIVDPDEPGRRLQPGDMWHDHDHDAAHGGACYAIVLPNRGIWYTCVPAHGSGLLWAVTGDAPNLTVTPSINDLDERAPWHGWIRNGEMTPA
jgi:hypothetical protein